MKLEMKSSQHTGRVPVTVFEIKGGLDASNTSHFQKDVEQAIEAGTQYIVFDLSELTYVSSMGLRAFQVIAKTLLSKSGQAAGSGISAGAFKSAYLKLLNPRQNVKETLEAMGFTMIMEIHSDLDQAIASF